MHPLGDQPFRLSSPYGFRTHPISGEYKLHNGVDYAASEGTIIYAPASGVVSAVGSDGSSGNWLKIDHGDGYETAYAHLLSYIAGRGDQVAAGEPIAEVGETGGATGPHLHFILRKDGSSTDPEPFITRTFRSYASNYWWWAVIGLGGVLAALIARRRFRG